MSDRLKNKNIIITGASGGIGAAMAALCAERGANLVLLARSYEKLLEMKADLESRFHVKVDIHKLDVSNTDEVQAVFSKILEQLDHVDILVNNAGYGILGEAYEAKSDDIKGMFAVNVVGLMACTSMVLPIMRQQGSGHIINIASQAGKIATPK